MIGKTLKIEKAAGHYEWGAKIVDGIGMQSAWVRLGRLEVEDLVRQINAASEQGAPWPKFEALPRRR